MKRYHFYTIFAISSMSIILLCVVIKKGEAAMKITSPAFGNNQMIPQKYTCEGEDINPGLNITEIPTGTKSLALIVDDPDAPMGTWVHWVVFNIQPRASIPENSTPGDQARNDFRRPDYGGPCPPSGTHRYFFKLYALDAELSVQMVRSKKDLEKAMQGHILDQSQLVGLYEKSY